MSHQPQVQGGKTSAPLRLIKNWNFDFLARLCTVGRSKERAFEQKEKSPQILSLIPMKSLTVWRRHSTRPSLPAGTARKVSGHLSGRRPLHLANARPFGRLKAPLGLSLLRCAAQTRACLGRRSRLIMQTTKNRKFPLGNSLLYISLSSVALAGCVRVDAPCFCFIVVGCTSNRITATPYRFLPAPARTTR